MLRIQRFLLFALLAGASALACAHPEEKAESGIAFKNEQVQTQSLSVADALGIGGSVHGYSLDCEGDEPRSGGSCTPTEPGNHCQECVAALCCSEQEACNSTQPMNACSFGSTLFEGQAIEGGEVACMMECLTQRSREGILVGDGSDLAACSGACSASECGEAEASSLTQALASCILGAGNAGDPNCRAECALLQ